MTCDDLREVDLPTERRWSLWCRVYTRPNHWRLEGYNSRDRLETIQETCLNAAIESIVLPPGETPITAPEVAGPVQRKRKS